MLHRNVGVQTLENGGWFLVAVNKIYIHEMVWQENLSPDPGTGPDEPSSYISHSCEPNLAWKDDHTLIAAKDIEPGEGITFDYATRDIDGFSVLPMNCYCGQPSCRGIIKPDDLIRYPDLRKKYQGKLPPTVEQWIKSNLYSNSIY